jgi:hypothetical protein
MSVHQQQLQFHAWLREHIRACPACGHSARYDLTHVMPAGRA